VIRRLPWLAALALAGCGERDDGAAGPPPPFNKVPPSLPREVRERTLAEWLERAQSPDAAKRAEVPWALVELAGKPSQIAPTLERLLADPSPHVRYAAAVAVGRSQGDLGPEVMRRLAGLLGSREPGLASAVRTALTASGARAVPALAEGLAGDDPERLRHVLRALGEIGADAAPAADAVVSLHARREDQRAQAVWTLKQMGEGAVPALVRRLPSASDDEAAALLGLLPATAGTLTTHGAALEAALRRAGLVRQAALELLTEAGAHALPLLDRLAKDADQDLAKAAGALAAQIRADAPR
jgi:hypothetical protein